MTNIEVKFAGGARDGDGGGINLFSVSVEGAGVFFGEYTKMFEDNGNDFHLRVGRFGFADRGAAGSTWIGMRKKFSEPLRQEIIRSVEHFFSEKRHILNLSPRLYGKSKIGDTEYETGWIR